MDYGYTASSSDEPIGPKFLRITDIVPDLIDWSSVPHCEIEDRKYEKYRLKCGDIVIARTGATTGYAKWIRDPRGAVFASYLVRLRISREVNSRYIGYIVESDAYKKFVEIQRGGAAQPNANAQVLSSYRFRLPPEAVQNQIVTVLCAYDDLIENNTRRIAILEEMAQVIYREWFVNFHFPGHEQVEMVDSDLGPIPEGWKVSLVGEITDVNARSVKSGAAPDHINYINISGVSPGRVDEVERMGWEDAPSRARRIVQHGDVIWSTVRPNLRAFSLVLRPEPDTVASTGFAVLSATKVPFSYLYLHTATPEFTDYLVNHTRGSAYPAVNVADFKGAPILLPEQRVLEEFHRTIEPLLQQQKVLADKNRILYETRGLLLPKLVSGEIDVSKLSKAPKLQWHEQPPP